MVDFSKLNKVIHEKGRLSIMTLLASRSVWSFADLKSELSMSDGNLITHLRALDKAGFVSMEKEGRQTHCQLTPEGTKSFENYLIVLEQIIEISKG